MSKKSEKTFKIAGLLFALGLLGLAVVAPGYASFPAFSSATVQTAPQEVLVDRFTYRID